MDERNNLVNEYKPDDDIEGVSSKRIQKSIRQALVRGDITEQELIDFIKARKNQK